jgi:subtilisin family serine protease
VHRLLLPLSGILLAGATTLAMATPAFAMPAFAMPAFAMPAFAMPADAAGGPYRATALPVTAPAPAPDVELIPGQYLVTMRAGADTTAALKTLKVAPSHSYNTGGFAAKLTPSQVKALSHNADVAIIEQDAWHHNVLDLTQSPVPSWGIDRIDQTNLPLSNTYSYFSSGERVHAYIIDTGIDPTHPEFGRRATFDFNAVDLTNTDCNNHGTHVAGTIGSTTYGVAKGVRLHGVKWLNCAGSGTTSGAVAAVTWVTNNAILPAVANTSWNVTFSTTLASALRNMMNRNVFLATSAGNTGTDSCDRLPRNLTGALAVASTTSTDARSSFSSIGACVDIYGPGSEIISTIPGGGTASFSGTSMSTPHATGIAALYKQHFGDTSQTLLHAWIINNSTPNVVTGSLSGTPNRLLNKRTL